ncbi:ShlB/FhaC/HecB family hemolysin secretion/activation protein [Burkholderia sp. AU28942]|uniref:ShlB/FhaC/HecB family hemolysin secretion/activation protein n=1 Tax=Burkholderia TaxID=32008 RepID=UPI000841557F|nr:MULTISPECIES: ShlB/FhaC/HecB family hemolysin secretion/activation protein [Burkholderia]AOK06852.1 peptidase S49 [Burkholderia latens]MCA8310005.1 ShlB/FhaC/HecB family hemolysin secretion/activation protein [Burkholderia sp. AU28942]QTO51630.1 ShlB/FhaC/HecB family hemolysin secretion/activation protein [Burkholderia latens]
MFLSIRAARTLCAANLLWFSLAIHAQPASPGARPPVANRGQEQQLDQLQQQYLRQPDVLSAPTTGASGRLNLPAEQPCFTIRTVEWRGADAFPWLASGAGVEGQCIGQQGLRMLREWANQQLAAHGYVTSLASLPAQDLSRGQLVVDILPGRIGEIRDDAARIGWTPLLFPHGPRARLNVRDLDQALENVRRLPGQAATAFDLVPGATLGDTDIVVRHPADARRVRVVATADNAGLDATGRNQLGVILSLDSPLHLYDQLLVTYNTDAAFRDKTRGAQSKSVAWNVPIGYASFAVGASEWTSRQPLDDLGGLVYANRTRRIEAAIGYVPYRSSHGKSTLRLRLARRDDRAWFDGSELLVLKHDLVTYDFSAAHREKFANATLDAAIGVRGSLPAFSRFPGYVKDRAQWDGRYRVFTVDGGLDTVFSVGTRRYGYRGTLRIQHAPSATPSTEFMQIGGRYTVRGFDGNSAPSGKSGWLVRNELATGLRGQEVYAALDAGGVSCDAYGERCVLAGAALGVRGSYRSFGFDVALGVPLRKPARLHTASPTLDVQLTSRF